MIELRVAAEDANPVEGRPPAEMGRRIVEHDDIDLTPSKMAGKLGRKPQAQGKSLLDRQSAIDQDGDIDIALAMRPVLGLAPEQIGRNQGRLVQPSESRSELRDEVGALWREGFGEHAIEVNTRSAAILQRARARVHSRPQSSPHRTQRTTPLVPECVA